MKFIQVNFGFLYETYILSVKEMKSMSMKVRAGLMFADVIIVMEDKTLQIVVSSENLINIARFLGDASFTMFMFEALEPQRVLDIQTKLSEASKTSPEVSKVE